jgi:hypothetical protein
MGMEALAGLGGLASALAASRHYTSMRGEELASLREQFVPIKGLASGDKVKWRPNQKNAKTPGDDEVVEVYRVFENPICEERGGSPRRCYDFSILVKDNEGEVIEYIFESRAFQLVEKAS